MVTIGDLSLSHDSEILACLFMAAAILVTEVVLPARTARVELRIQKNHIIPGTVQIVLLTYWSLYWSQAWEIPRIPLELLFAFQFDYFIDRVRGRTWQAGLGPVPIVLSSNLFIRFPAVHFDGILVIVAIAIASKRFLRYRGRHVFNPSALGLALFGLVHHLTPGGLHFLDIAHQLNLPPNMGELIFGLGLIVALRVPIVMVTLGAAAGLQVWNDLPGSVITPWPYWPAMLLVFTFLATDPVTIPRSGVGRVLFGLSVGFGTGLASNLLVAAGVHDYFGKIFAVPVCNLLVPVFDRVGRWLPLEAPVAARWNPAHVAAYCVVFLMTYHAFRKAGAFETELHASNRTPLIVTDAGAVPRCEDNPTFCRPFSVVEEVQGWAQRPDRASYELSNR